MHSTASDGSLPVRELVRAVHEAGVSAFALTDHDTLDGMEEAADEARRLGLVHVTGVEISTRIDQLELHILGYGFDVAHPALVTALEGQKAARHARIPKLVARLNELGAAIDVEDVVREAGRSNPGRPHVARALVTRGVCQSTEEAFQRFLGDHAPGNVRKLVPTPKEAIAWIHSAGGRAVWAHPLARPIQRPGGFELLMRELRAAGLDGIEEIHPSQDPGARKRIRRLARELELKLTGGSDFHGAASPGVRLGVGRGADRVELARLEALLS